MTRVSQSCLSEIEKRWQQTPESRRPWGIWISHHQPIERELAQSHTDVISAWFLSNKGIRQRNVWDYVRFRLVQSGQFWCSKTVQSEPSPVLGGIGCHEIGLASFAQVKNEPMVYLDFVFGGLDGWGCLYQVQPSGEITFDSKIWVA